MRLATVRTAAGTRAVRIDADHAVDLGAADVGEVLRRPGWRDSTADVRGEAYALDALDYAPLVVAPEKVICVGLNYRNHILEMGRELPDHPTLFAKYARALIGARDPIRLPTRSQAVDWEAELAVVLGAEARDLDRDQAGAVIAGYTVLNDVTCRDWQYRTGQWLQGKTFEATTPIGPWLVTDDSGAEPPARALTCRVGDELMQSANTGELVFDPWDLVAYISTVLTLVPGDVIATGTPGGVGHARTPKRYLRPGDELVTDIDGIGTCRNECLGAAVTDVTPG
jgi:acylpyruvate hydrolase